MGEPTFLAARPPHSASESRYRALFNAIDEGFCVIEFLDGPHGPLSDYIHIEANAAYARHTGIPNVVGQKLRDMVPAEADDWLARYRPVLVDGRPIRFEQTLVATGRHLELAAFRIEPPELRQVAVLFTDVTARRDAEQQLRRYAAELAEGDRLKNEFIAMLAHELRGPLAPIGNMLEAMKRAPGDEEVVRRARDMIERQHASLHRLVDDLLDLNRITRGKLELRPQRTDLRSVLDHALETMRPAIQAAGHQVDVTLPAVPVHLEADPVRLAQVFGNLLHNACKYMAPGGHISVGAILGDDDTVAVSVRDTGVGIPPDKLEAIFEMFAQVDRTLEGSRGGLGIGLTLVRRLVELHGGSVRARSEGPGHGSEFIVTLPTSEPPGAMDIAAGSRPELSGRRILVVDDNPDTAASLAMLLEMSGNETTTANDGLQAIEKAAAFHPDIALLDIGLPGLSGYDTCRAMRRETWGKDMTILALSGWGQEDDRRRSKEAGFDAHLVKPVDYPALMELLGKLSRGKGSR